MAATNGNDGPARALDARAPTCCGGRLLCTTRRGSAPPAGCRRQRNVHGHHRRALSSLSYRHRRRPTAPRAGFTGRSEGTGAAIVKSILAGPTVAGVLPTLKSTVFWHHTQSANR